jgi:hypothetical protein
LLNDAVCIKLKLWKTNHTIASRIQGVRLMPWKAKCSAQCSW